MNKHLLAPVLASIALLLLCAAPEAHAQRTTYQQMMDFNKMMMNRINNQTIAKNMCDEWRRKGEKVPAECGNASSSSSSSSAPPASPTATRFTPVAGDDAVKKLADSLGSDPEERQQILQLAAAGQEIFAKKYKGKWNNTIAGAMTFFIASAYTVGNDREPSMEAEERLFSSLNATLAQSDIVRASNAEKTALYNVLLAGAGLPLVFYVDGKQNDNAAQVNQAKKMADGFGQQFFKMDLQAISRMLGEGETP